ncbi:unnamed protein product [Knipowitschia caucasica]
MQTAVLLSLLFFSAAFAAPAEDLNTEPLKTEDLKTEPLKPEDLKTEDLQAFEAAPEEQLPLVADSASEDAPEGRNACPVGWYSHNGRCYSLIVNAPKSWYDAQEHCRQMGANLASVFNPSDYKFMQQMIQPTGHSEAWIGGFYLQDRWMWIDGYAMHYQYWHIQYSGSSYSCVYLQSTSGWVNTSCDKSHRFICSKSAFSC